MLRLPPCSNVASAIERLQPQSAPACRSHFGGKPRAASAVCACVLTGCLALGSGVALTALQADEALAVTNETEFVPSEFQKRVEDTAAAYDDATAKVEQLESDISSNEKKLSDIEGKLPEQHQRAEDAMCALYKLQQDSHGLLDVVLGAETLNEFFENVNYINHLQDRNISEMQALQDMQTDLEKTRTKLTDAKDQAYDEQKKAEKALEEAKAARAEAQRKAREEAERKAREEAERKAREAAEKKAAEEAAKKAAAEKTAKAEKQAAADKKAAEDKKAAQAASTEKKKTAEKKAAAEPDSGSQASESEETVEPPSDDGANWNDDKSAFVKKWASRIDAYLSGSPMAGQGKTFAEAAWEYGVDPRWSPAISNTESSKGAVCFKPHNAWGWGGESWGSWEEAINDHVRGLARGYGYTISETAAKKYCPPNWQHWYNSTLAQMNSI